MDGWNTIVSFWGPAIFRGELLVSESVFQIDDVKINDWNSQSWCFKSEATRSEKQTSSRQNALNKNCSQAKNRLKAN